MVTRQNLKLSIAAFQDRLNNPQLQQQHVFFLEELQFDSKTDNRDNSSVTLQARALRAYPDQNILAFAAIDAYAADAAAGQTRFEQDTARRAEMIPSAQKTRSVRNRHHFVKLMPEWLRENLLEQPEKTTGEDI